MKFLVTVMPRPALAPLELVEAGRNWVEQKLKDGTLDCVYGFPTGGGIGIENANSHDELMRNLTSYPLFPFVEMTVQPLASHTAAFEAYRAISQRTAAAGA